MVIENKRPQRAARPAEAAMHLKFVTLLMATSLSLSLNIDFNGGEK
jgi:hypothetical protein